MHIIAVQFDLDPKDRERFLADRRESQLISQGEDGCLEFFFSSDALDPGRVHLFEVWESHEAHEAHIAARDARQQANPPTVPGASIREQRVSRYEVLGEPSLT